MWILPLLFILCNASLNANTRAFDSYVESPKSHPSCSWLGWACVFHSAQNSHCFVFTFFFSFYFQIHSCSEESISLEALLFSWLNELVDCFCQTGLSINKTTVTLDGPDHARRPEARRCLEVWFASMSTHFCVYFYTREDQFFYFYKNINSLFLSYFYFCVCVSCSVMSNSLQPHGM